MNNRLRRCGTLFCALGILLFMTACLLFPAAAADAEHSLTLFCRSEDVTFSDMQWNLYSVGERVGSASKRTGEDSYVLTGDFSKYPVAMDDLSASAMQDAADTLENYAVVDQLVPLDSGKTDETGTLCFGALKKGLYLLSGYSKVIGDTRYIPSAVLIEFSDADESLDLQTYPKFQKKKLLTSNTARYTVSKVWLHDENYLSDRSNALKIALYCNREFEREIVLDASNDWTYSWSSDSLSEWRVKEVEVPANYTVVYRGNEMQFAIINSHGTVWSSTVTPSSTESLTTASELQTEVSLESSTVTELTAISVTSAATSAESTAVTATVVPLSVGSSSGTGGKLPQTGQLWWPVPVLSAAGLVLIIVGVKLHGKSS